MIGLQCIFLFVLFETSRMVIADHEIIDYKDAKVIFFTGPTHNDFETYSIDKAAAALDNNPEFDKKRTTLFIPDYYEVQVSSSHYTEDAYLKLDNENFLRIDWGTPKVENKGEVKQPDVKNVRRPDGTRQLARMSALDPPKNITIMGVPVTSDITDHVVDFIDVIHTSTGKGGTLIRLGHVDFWPDGGNAQRGCEDSDDDDCSHRRSWAYWDESVLKQNGNGKQFCAYKSTSYEAYKNGVILSEPTFIGIDCDTDISGDYFLDVNPEYLFAQGCKDSSLPIWTDN